MSCNGLLVVTKCIAAHFPHEVDKQKPIQSFLMAVMKAILVLFVFRKLSGPPRVAVKGGS